MLLTTALMATSCMHEIKVFSDDGPKVTQVRHIKDFEEIEIMGSPTVYYQQGNTYGVKVVGSEDQVDKIVTEKNGQTLVIRNKGKIGVLIGCIKGMESLSPYFHATLFFLREVAHQEMGYQQRRNSNNDCQRHQQNFHLSDSICPLHTYILTQIGTTLLNIYSQIVLNF